MRKIFVSALSLAVALYIAPAFAQHAHGAGAGAGAGAGMGMSGASHANAGHANTNSAGTTGSSAAATNGKTMDQLLTQNTKLSDKIASLTGESAQQACSGFKNLGQCVAAAHVSKNLGLSFADLQSKMTGSGSESLGKAIQDLGGPNVNSKSESKKANKQANEDLAATVSQS